MEKLIWNGQDDECTRDVWVNISLTNLKEAVWQRLLYLDKERNRIVESAWEFSSNNDDSFVLAKENPPVEVAEEYARLRPELVAQAMGEVIPA